MELTESVAVVTGASAGIGEATARALAREGSAVVLVARRAERLATLADDIDGETLVAPTDVTDPDAVDAMVAATRERFGRIDVLVNNAGVATFDPVAEADGADLRRQVAVNLLGTMNTVHAALPAVLDGGGHVVCVSSMNAEYPAERGSAYTASKCGVNGFHDSLRKEMREEDVRVTTVMPGPVVTEMHDWAEWDGRALDPDDVADAIVFAVSRPDHVELRELTVDATDKRQPW
ncbi:SDR family oxidoreductase [Haloarchaeobius litoreus]|uniref:SDR family oxidoreductase n=1 Tax=Haloarchaeobius litoreus TaxID=755306 RepID=A0ABD6DFF7_9EURY|nr:SDR family oxidoreductase [Haloarchaeobius litoreus]